jgi:hypothetical protein
MQTFLEYAIHRVKTFEPKRLHNLYLALKKGGLAVINRIHQQNDPHLWVQAHPQPEEYRGLRIYLLGNICAFRVQKLEKTEPYGKSYLLDLQEMYDNILEDLGEEEDNKDPNMAMNILIKQMCDKIRKFYIDSIKDEEEFLSAQLNGPERQDIGGAAILPVTGIDYSSQVYSTKN